MWPTCHTIFLSMHLIFRQEKTKYSHHVFTVSLSHLIYISLSSYYHHFKKTNGKSLHMSFHTGLCSCTKQAFCWASLLPAILGCLLLCLPSLGLPGYCRASWNDSWVWQMSGTAGCVLDYPKSLDSTVIHHCPNYLCIDCGTLCDSPVMANYPGYLWYSLHNGLVGKKKTVRKWKKNPYQ